MIWYRITSPHQYSALPLRFNIHRRTSIRFGENQLALISIGISPLTTTHPLIFQHQSVRTSIWFYPSFILAMVRSIRFGSITSDQRSIQARFHYGSELSLLTVPLTISRRNILQQARSKTLKSSYFCLYAGNFTFFSLPSRGSFHHSLAVLFAIGHTVIFSLMRWSSQIHTGFHVPHAT